MPVSVLPVIVVSGVDGSVYRESRAKNGPFLGSCWAWAPQPRGPTRLRTLWNFGRTLLQVPLQVPLQVFLQVFPPGFLCCLSAFTRRQWLSRMTRKVRGGPLLSMHPRSQMTCVAVAGARWLCRAALNWPEKSGPFPSFVQVPDPTNHSRVGWPTPPCPDLHLVRFPGSRLFSLLFPRRRSPHIQTPGAGFWRPGAKMLLSRVRSTFVHTSDALCRQLKMLHPCKSFSTFFSAPQPSNPGSN